MFVIRYVKFCVRSTRLRGQGGANAFTILKFTLKVEPNRFLYRQWVILDRNVTLVSEFDIVTIVVDLAIADHV